MFFSSSRFPEDSPSAGLPHLATGHIECGQPTVSVAGGVDAADIVQVEYLAVLLFRVSDDDRFSRAMWPWPWRFEQDPPQHVGWLLRKGQTGIVVGVEKRMGGGFEIVEPATDQCEVRIGQHVDARPESIRIKRIDTATHEPGIAESIALQGTKQHLFVVAHQRHQTAVRLQRQQRIDDIAGVTPRIDEVPQLDNAIVAARGDHFEERVECMHAPVDIANGDNASRRGMGRWFRRTAGASDDAIEGRWRRVSFRQIFGSVVGHNSLQRLANRLAFVEKSDGDAHGASRYMVSSGTSIGLYQRSPSRESPSRHHSFSAIACFSHPSVPCGPLIFPVGRERRAR